MKFFTFTVMLVALSRCQGSLDKRGVVAGQQAYTPQQTYSAQAAPSPASLLYSKVQQPVATKALVAAVPQPQYYTAQTAPATYSLAAQQQLQYQPQAQTLAYAQPTLAKYAAAPAPAAPAVATFTAAPAVKVAAAAPVYRQPFSLANDVSSFTYSSPVVSYNNLGLLSQVVGKLPSPSEQAKAAPAPAAYQAQPAYAAAQLAQAKLALPAAQPAVAQRYVAAAPQQQQYLSQASQQAYEGLPQAQAYQTPSYAAQTAPQAIYAPIPQYYTGAQQLKQVSPGVAYAQ